jgi:hypothetical protein
VYHNSRKAAGIENAAISDVDQLGPELCSGSTNPGAPRVKPVALQARDYEKPSMVSHDAARGPNRRKVDEQVRIRYFFSVRHRMGFGQLKCPGRTRHNRQNRRGSEGQ